MVFMPEWILKWVQMDKKKVGLGSSLVGVP